MYFKLKPTKKPHRAWARKTPGYLYDHFKEAFNDTDFIERDNLTDDIVTIHFIPTNYKNVPIEYNGIIHRTSTYFETICIWDLWLEPHFTQPVITFSVTGHESNVLLTLKVLEYVINGYNTFRYDLQEEYRRTKINQRRRAQNNGHKLIGNGDARIKAKHNWHGYIYNLDYALSKIIPKYSLYRQTKQIEISRYILRTKKLDFKDYAIKRAYELKDAYCKRSAIILNRIIR